MNIEQVVSAALTSDHGIGFTLPDALAARNFRLQFYAMRRRKIKAGDTTWNNLACTVPTGEPNKVRLFKKTSVPSVIATRQHGVSETWALSRKELPGRLRSRALPKM